ncbi:MAG TPA: GNAT family N-acetyltransferase [Gaiellales bacterium]|nr:GNAT family N-acetyltransferase [Gaiellales bacterium]
MEIRIVGRDLTRELRRAVLRPSWPPESPMHGDENTDALHLAALADDGEVIGTCLILPRAFPPRPEVSRAWQLRGMATAPTWRGRGVGAAVLAAAVEQARRRAGELLWCDARTTAVPFYRKHGFAAEGAEFLHAESGILHYRMWRMI